MGLTYHIVCLTRLKSAILFFDNSCNINQQLFHLWASGSQKLDLIVYRQCWLRSICLFFGLHLLESFTSVTGVLMHMHVCFVGFSALCIIFFFLNFTDRSIELFTQSQVTYKVAEINHGISIYSNRSFCLFRVLLRKNKGSFKVLDPQCFMITSTLKSMQLH